jgi:membrane peptidoglycan carboxypeptidase
MGGYQYGRGDSTDDDPRSPGQGGGRRGYGASGAGPGQGPDGADGSGNGQGQGRGYGAPSGYGQQPPPPRQPQPPQHPQQPPGGYGSPSGYDPYGGSPRPTPTPIPTSPPTPPASGAGGGGRRGYGSGSGAPNSGAAGPGGGRGTRGRAASEAGPGDFMAPSPPSSDVPPGYDYISDPAQTRVAPPDSTGAVPPPRRSRLEERRASRGGDASQAKSEQYPESALNGRSTRNGAAARSRARAKERPTGPVKRTGYHRYFDYPRTGKYGWKHWMPSVKQVCGGFLTCVFLVIGFIAFEYETVQIPDAHSSAFAQESQFTYNDAATDFATAGPDNTDRQVVDYSAIPKMTQDAVVSQENKTFWTDPGVSYTGTIRALLVDLTGGSTQGGSTITQQYVKNAFLTQAQTTSRKIEEIFISLKLAKQYSKQQIMADYLNTSYFGRDASGIAAAAQNWFGLTLPQMEAEPVPLQASQSAFMSMMLNSPSYYAEGWDPTQSAATQAQAKSAALARWQATLSNMELYKYLTPAQYKQAVADTPKPVALSTNAGESIQDVQMQQAAMNWLDSYNSTHTGAEAGPTSAQIAQGGYTVVTTFNKADMALAQQAVQTELLSSEDSYDKSTLSPGLAAVDPSNGDLVAFYGGDTYENSATTQTVEGGSTFKAFTLATALTNNWSPKSFVSGNPWPDPTVPSEVQEDAGDLGGGITNDGSTQKIGPITLQHAVDDSVNTAFVRVEMQQPGAYNAVEQMAEGFGLSSSIPGWNDTSGGCDNVRFTLGVCAVDPARMADAYSVLAANGTLHQLVEIQEIKLPDGDIWKPTETTTQPISSNVAATETSMLTGVIHQSDGTANSAYEAGSLRMTNIAGKTGTSTMTITPDTTAAMQQVGYNDHDGTYDTAGIWFDGFSSKLAVSVGISRWTDVKINGNEETVQLPVDNIDDSGNDYGAQYPFGIWDKFMQLMQNTSYGGDNAFTAPVPNPNATVMNSPTPSALPTTTTPTATKTKASAPPPIATTASSAPPSLTASPSDTDTCLNQPLFGQCETSSASASSTPTATDTGGGGNGGGGHFGQNGSG